jgi:glucose dehydrogenase|tara:strand:+ start:337 stop:534 length:198 start_codon:yes stop_codon:yes gene_type:complete
MNLENIPDQKKMTAGFYYSLIILAGIFWLLWGLKFGVWWDIGLYAVLVVMIGFGLIGGFVYGKQS